jgi:CRP-like cAMP-binding protein
MEPSDKFATSIFRKGEYLLKEGQRNAGVFLITKGKVEIRAGTLDDSPLVLGTRGPGDILGEMAAVDDQPHMASAVALEETTATVMSRNEFQRRLNAMDPIMRGTILAIVRRAREMGEFLSEKGETINWHAWRKKST